MGFAANFFKVVQEDARTENQLLELETGDRLLCIASAGEMPLNLLSMQDIHINAVDTELNQIFLSKLKLAAALQFSTEKAAGFLGYLPMDNQERKNLYIQLQKNLSQEEHNFWSQHSKVIENGAIKAGRFEQYIASFRSVALLILKKSKLKQLLSCEGIKEQQSYFDSEVSTFLLKGLFKIIFHPGIYKKRGIHENRKRHSH